MTYERQGLMITIHPDPSGHHDVHIVVPPSTEIQEIVIRDVWRDTLRTHPGQACLSFRCGAGIGVWRDRLYQDRLLTGMPLCGDELLDRDRAEDGGLSARIKERIAARNV